MSTKPKVMVIGLDGASPHLITRWVNEARLPTFKNLRQSGFFSDLLSTTPTNTAPAGRSMVAWVNPGGHGIFYFTNAEFGKVDDSLVSSHDVRSRAICHILTDFGRR